MAPRRCLEKKYIIYTRLRLCLISRARGLILISRGLTLILTVDTGAVVVESGHGGAGHADVQDDHLRSYKVEDVNINVT